MSSGLVREVIDIDAPPQVVWEHVVDWPRQGEWMPATRVRALGDAGGDAGGSASGVGARIEAWTGLGPIGLLDSMTVTAWDPPRRCEVLHTGRLLRGEGGFVVAPNGPGRSRFEWWERFALPAGPLGALAWPAARPAVRAGLRYALHSLKRTAESAATSQ